MIETFPVDNLDVERLLVEWRWLCPHKMSIVARTAFGDLFLRDESGRVFWLDTAVGKLVLIAPSENEFRVLSESAEKREEWFAEQDFHGFADRGLVPTSEQCIGFSTPLVFAEGAHDPYVAELYEYVSFLGDLHRQLSDVPDGGEVRLKVGAPPGATT
jgi:hypothetical protein